MSYHNPVLLNESVEALLWKKSGVFVDCTFGGGGHSKAILSKINNDAQLYAFDQDKDALNNKIDDQRFQLIMQNFRFLKNNLRFLGVKKVTGVLADLGVSSHQFDTPHRGFSTRFDGELDMRMNVQAKISAKNIVNEYSEEELANILYYYGELRASRKIAKEIVTERSKGEIKTINQLKEIFNYIPKNKANKFYAQLFQAIRIEVNDEMSALKEMLIQSSEVLEKNGRLVVISYHSLEDRLVKRFMKTGLFEGEPKRDVYGNWEAPLKPLQNKVIIPSQEEINKNPRARSAKMRIALKN